MSFNRRRFSLALAVGMIGYAPAIGRALAQTTQPPATRPQIIPPPVPPGSPRPNETIPEKQKPPSSSDATDGSGSNLSDKLEKSDGIIKPPTNTDGGMVKPAPDSGTATTPVIPPPGSPGGRRDVTPK
jgi:hypothetical protein